MELNRVEILFLSYNFDVNTSRSKKNTFLDCIVVIEMTNFFVDCVLSNAPAPLHN